LRNWTVALALVVAAVACEGARNTKKIRDEACQRNYDCGFGLDCVEGAQLADGGTAAAKTCQFHVYGECQGDGIDPSGQQQCVGGQRCREGHCTVQCGGNGDCKQGEICRIGVCQKSQGVSYNQCYDNRDCHWPDTCFYGQCVTRTDAMRCNTDLDCGSGGRCIDGRCM
jgi:hypothetical protein